MSFKRNGLLGVVVFTGLIAVVGGQQRPADWPQWRGPNRDGALAAFTAPAAWPEQLTQKWKVEVGIGYATPLVVGNRVYVFSRLGEDEVMSAIDPDNGKAVWQTKYPVSFTMNSAAARHGAGPKSTPAFANGRLYSIGSAGAVTSFDAATGRQVWQKPGSSVQPMYTNNAFSPLVDRGLVIFHTGGHDKGALTAFDVNTGAVKWIWSGDGPGYGSPILADFGGVRQIVTLTQAKAVGIDVETGALLWERPYVSPNFTSSITPVRYGDTIIIWGATNNAPMSAWRIGRQNNQWMVETVWENADIPGRLSNAVLDGDVMFGLSSRNMGQYYAVDVKTGKPLWTSEGRQANNIALLRAGDILFSLENDGELVILRANRTQFELLRRYRVSDAETFSTWAQPAISGERIFIKDSSTLALWTLN